MHFFENFLSAIAQVVSNHDSSLYGNRRSYIVPIKSLLG